ncbi:MAG: hypothetical protein EBZ47_01650 [Chlamydiae bacterium]|nr:hypothetical protein [Chlamydiota bacterium]
MKKAAVIPAQGIGDALLMLITSYNLHEAGYHVTTFQPILEELEPWLKTKQFAPIPDDQDLTEVLSSFDLVILQNDNSERSRQLIQLRKTGKIKHLIVFYPTYQFHKHGSLTKKDYPFEPEKSMVENIAKATARLLKLAGVSRNNGMLPLPGLVHRKNSRRIVFHPTSKDCHKNWPKKKFLILAHKLQKQGYEIVFAVSTSERDQWQGTHGSTYLLPDLNSLSELAKLIFESKCIIGNDSLVGHLASNLQIPSLIIANDKRRMRLWRPDWLKSELVTPPKIALKWLPNKFKKKYWGHLISVNRVLSRFKKIEKRI